MIPVPIGAGGGRLSHSNLFSQVLQLAILYRKRAEQLGRCTLVRAIIRATVRRISNHQIVTLQTRPSAGDCFLTDGLATVGPGNARCQTVSFPSVLAMRVEC